MKTPSFTVVGGYLGSGKTTLVNHLLANGAGLRVAVLVNDFGAINVDEQLIAARNGDTISLANGCMCCSLTGGFASAILGVLKRADRLDAIVVEASGVADPGRIARYGQMYDLPLDGVLVVVDAERIFEQADNKYVGDTVLRQLAQADLILLNKIDCVSSERLGAVRCWLAARTHAAICETEYSQAPISILLGRAADATKPAPGRFVAEETDHASLYRTWTLRKRRPVDRAAITRLADSRGREIYRAKGFVQLSEAPARRHLLQQVGRRWTLEDFSDWGGAEPVTEIVCIGPA